MTANKIASYLIIAIAGTYILYIGKTILMPFVLAVIIWFLIQEIRTFFKKIPLVKMLPNWLLSTLSTLVIFIILGVVGSIVGHNIQTLSESPDKYVGNIGRIVGQLNDTLGIDLGIQISSWIHSHGDQISFMSILGTVLSSLSDLFGQTFLIILYILFILLEESSFNKKLQAIYSTESSLNKMNGILVDIDKALSNYFALKTLVSFITGTLSWIALVVMGVEAPLFWAFIIFLLNYIPTIGSLIATVFPAFFALLQFGDFTTCLIVLGVIGAIQLIIGNIVEPKMMGDTLNISSLVVLLSLAFWGAIWGITGMILCVPITVMMIIIFAQFPSTRPIAILLSEKGSVGKLDKEVI